MKRLIALELACTMILSACGQSSSYVSNKTIEGSVTSGAEPNETESTSEESSQSEEVIDAAVIEESENDAVIPLEYKTIIPEYSNLNDERLLRFVEDNVYTELVSDLNNTDYFIENVTAVYVSNEYLEELAYNSQANIFFGYTLKELDEEFDGTRYVFTLGEDGTTVVRAFEDYDDTYQQIIKNVSIGTGVILVCVTVSVATAGSGAPAISMIFAGAAKTGTTFALSSGFLSFAASSIITGIQTGNFDDALKAGALAGSESFKWGAITGVIAGGVSEGVSYAKAMQALKGVTLNGLTTQEAAAIQMESGFPIDIIKQFHSMDEYNVYKEAQLSAQMINGELALVRDIDLTYKSEFPNGEIVSNLERMARGYAPIEPATGKAYQLHHIGQKANATLAVLTEAEHQGNATILNMLGKESEINRAAFESIRKAFWKSFAAAVS